MEKARLKVIIKNLEAAQVHGLAVGNPMADAGLLSDFLTELASDWVGDNDVRYLLEASAEALHFANAFGYSVVPDWTESIGRGSQKH